MSVAGIFSSSLFNYINPSAQNKTQGAQNNTQQFQQQLQQLGQALQSGDLSSAQTDAQTLQQQFGPQSASTISSQSSTPITQEFNQLSQDLGSGNLSGAQQDFATIQQSSQEASSHAHHHHQHQGGSSEESAISQSLNQVGQALQAGNLSAAQQAYSTVQQEFLQIPQGSAPTSPSSSTSFAVNI